MNEHESGHNDTTGLIFFMFVIALLLICLGGLVASLTNYGEKHPASALVFDGIDEGCKVYQFYDEGNTSNHIKRCATHTVYSKQTYCGKSCFYYKTYADVIEINELDKLVPLK